jgi:hypothetical protein
LVGHGDADDFVQFSETDATDSLLKRRHRRIASKENAITTEVSLTMSSKSALTLFNNIVSRPKIFGDVGSLRAKRKTRSFIALSVVVFGIEAKGSVSLSAIATKPEATGTTSDAFFTDAADRDLPLGVHRENNRKGKVCHTGS